MATSEPSEQENEEINKIKLLITSLFIELDVPSKIGICALSEMLVFAVSSGCRDAQDLNMAMDLFTVYLQSMTREMGPIIFKGREDSRNKYKNPEAREEYKTKLRKSLANQGIVVVIPNDPSTNPPADPFADLLNKRKSEKRH